MSQIKFLQTGSWRLGSSMTGLSDPPVWLRRVVASAIRQSVQNVMDAAVGAACSFVLVQGRLADRENFAVALAWLAEQLPQWHHRGVRLVVSGHDVDEWAQLEQLGVFIVRPGGEFWVSAGRGGAEPVLSHGCVPSGLHVSCGAHLSAGAHGSARLHCQVLVPAANSAELIEPEETIESADGLLSVSGGSPQGLAPDEPAAGHCVLVTADLERGELRARGISAEVLQLVSACEECEEGTTFPQLLQRLTERSRSMPPGRGLRLVDWEIRGRLKFSCLSGVWLRELDLLGSLRRQLNAGHSGTWPCRLRFAGDCVDLSIESMNWGPAMYLQDIRIDESSGVSAGATEGLPRGMTVISGPPGVLSGWQQNLRGLLSDLGVQGSSPASVGLSGELSVLTGSRLCLVRRSRASARAELFWACSVPSTEVRRVTEEVIPEWLRGEDFAQFCVAGAGDPDEVQMLGRLSVLSEAKFAESPDLERARAALQQVLIERDGNGLEGGNVHRISELRRRQGELQRRLSALRNPADSAKARAAELRQSIRSVESELETIHERLEQLEVERQQASRFSLAAEFVCSGRAPQSEGVAGSSMIERWLGIRAAVSADLAAAISSAPGGLLLSSDSLSAMRESILRVEEKFRQLADAGNAGGLSETDMGLAGASLQQVRQEVNSLNHRLADYEQQLVQQPAGTLQPLLERCLLAVEAVLAELDSQGIEQEVSRRNSERIQQLDLERARNEEQRGMLLQRLQELQSAVATAVAPKLSARVLEQLDQLQAEYAELDAEVLRLEQQRRQLDGAERSLRELITRLTEAPRSGVFEIASGLLRQLTRGVLRGLRAESEQLFATTEQGLTVRVPELPQTQRLQVCLSLRLALQRVIGASEGTVPLILGNDLLRQASESVEELLRILIASCEQGQQVLLLAEEKVVQGLSKLPGLEHRCLATTPEVREAAPPRLVLHRVEQEIESPESQPVAVVVEAVTAPVVSVVSSGDAQRGSHANWLFYLEPADGVEELASISLGELEALRAARIGHVGELLERTIPDLEESIRLRGYVVPVERLQALRGQAELAGRVPMLRRGDAALLYAAGITTADELRRLRPETVYERVTAFQRSDGGIRWRRGGRLIDRQQALNWARFGQFARSLEELRAEWPGPVAAAALVTADVAAAGAADAASEAGAGADVSTGAAAESAGVGSSRVIITRRRRQVPATPASTARRARRVAKREQLAAQLRVDPQPVVSAEGQPVERLGGMRFYLSRTSDVVQAPSIGPRTAELLHGAGVRTIEELLSVPAERLSEKLSQKRVTAEVVRRWQVQAQLVCRIPELRGHDAQILAACGITSPELLASRSAEELLSAMRPFLESAEGRRILRNQDGPDLQEVSEWIQWAANARPLRAA